MSKLDISWEESDPLLVTCIIYIEALVPLLSSPPHDGDAVAIIGRLELMREAANVSLWPKRKRS